VISPEGCAAILWRSATEAERAAIAMEARRAGPPRDRRRRRADPEPAAARTPITSDGGGDQEPRSIAQLDRLSRVPRSARFSSPFSLRYERFRAFGTFIEPNGGAAPAPPQPWWRRILRNPLEKGGL